MCSIVNFYKTFSVILLLLQTKLPNSLILWNFFLIVDKFGILKAYLDPGRQGHGRVIKNKLVCLNYVQCVIPWYFIHFNKDVFQIITKGQFIFFDTYYIIYSTLHISYIRLIGHIILAHIVNFPWIRSCKYYYCSLILICLYFLEFKFCIFIAY